MVCWGVQVKQIESGFGETGQVLPPVASSCTEHWCSYNLNQGVAYCFVYVNFKLYVYESRKTKRGI